MPKRVSIKGKGAEWFTEAPTTEQPATKDVGPPSDLREAGRPVRQHQLLISEFRIAITVAAQRRHGHELLTWLSDLEAKGKYLVFDRQDGDRRVKPFTLDTFFTYVAPDPDPAKKPGRIACFLEIEVCA